VHRIVLFSFAVFSGRADLYAARFDDGLSLFEAQIQGEWRVARASVRRMLDLRTSAPEQQVGALTFAEGTTVKVDQTSGWATQLEDTTSPARLSAPDPTTANP
jgi:hypothetical protein